MKTSLLVMTLNEIDGMKAIMPQVQPDWVDQIIIVDGGSTDGTIEWARDSGYEVYVQKQPGFRHAYTEVMPQIIGDVLITFSPDGNSIPSVIPELVTKMREGYDMVIACGGDGTVGEFGGPYGADDGFHVGRCHHRGAQRAGAGLHHHPRAVPWRDAAGQRALSAAAATCGGGQGRRAGL